MQIKASILTYLFFGLTLAFGQKKSKADGYFFSYNYKDAVAAYEADLGKGVALSPEQRTNLADAYYKIGNYEQATTEYLQLFAQDSILGDYHLNMMLQGLVKTKGAATVREFLQTENLNLSEALQENAAFNANLLASGDPSTNLDFKVFNIEANSPQSDFSPTFYGTNLLFTSGRPLGKRASYGPSGESYLNIFNAPITEAGMVSGGEKFKDIQASDYHKATPYFSEELNSVFYVLSNTFEGDLEFDDKGKNALSIGMQKIEGDFKFLWRDLSTSFYYPFYDAATSRLYFAANLEGGFGGTDLYYVNTSRGQIMSAPVNLGPKVNTPGNEIAPYLFEGTLYFSSDVFYGLGGMDIYKSNVDQNKSFSIPVNLGGQINSEKDDFGFVIRNEGEGLLGYFSSNRPGGLGGDDIYGFLVDEKPGIKTLALAGQVLRRYAKDPLAKVAVSMTALDGTLLKEVYTDEKGNFRIEVPWQEAVDLKINKSKFSTYKHRFDAAALDKLQKNPWSIDLMAYEDVVEEKEKQAVVKLRKFYFDKGQAKMTQEVATELDKVVAVVKAFPAVELRIESHSDSRGGGATNFRLTQARSDAIKKYLVENGVPSSNILYAIGYGEDQLVNQCKNGVFCLEMQHKENERSRIVILNDNILFD